jgi:hypothetical protein
MARKDTEHVVELLLAQRLSNSTNGNPRYRLTLRARDGIAYTTTTMSDISDAYDIGSPGIRPGCWVKITVSPAGRVRHIEPAGVIPGGE